MHIFTKFTKYIIYERSLLFTNYICKHVILAAKTEETTNEGEQTENGVLSNSLLSNEIIVESLENRENCSFTCLSKRKVSIKNP